MDESLSVLAIGEPLIELADIGDQRLEWTFGGDTFNCLAALAAAAPVATAHYLTGLGDDPASGWFSDFAAQLGIDMSQCPIVTGRNLGLSWISRSDGDRTFRYWRGESAARAALRGGVHLGDPLPSAIVLSSITLAVAGPSADALLDDVAAARQAGATVAFDTNHRTALWPDSDRARSIVERALGAADIVHASADDVVELWDDSAEEFCDRAIAAGAADVTVTDGPGSIVALADGARIRVEPPTTTVLDTTGAGDAFFGTYLGHRLRGAAAPYALDHAVGVATRVVQSRGALTYLGSEPEA